MKRMKKYLTLVGLLAMGLAVPLSAFAQNNTVALQNVFKLTQTFGNIVGLAIPIAFSLSLLFFFWGLAKYIYNAGDEDARNDGKQMMVWGVVAMFVVSSVWGLVALIRTTFGVNNNDTGTQPKVTVNRVNFGDN